MNLDKPMFVSTALLAASLCCNAARASTGGPPLFAPATNYTLPTAANVVAVGDFNGDGNPDVVVVMPGQTSTGTIGVLLGNGDGTFQPVVTTPVGNTPMAIAVADYNGDGQDDVGVVDMLGGAQGTGDLQILISRGDGTFQTPIIYYPGASPDFVAAGDFNNDGNIDLAVNNLKGGPDGAGNGSILLGNGDGTFQAPANFPAGVRPVLIAVGDFNSDGILDLAVTANSVELNLFLGNGDGTFREFATYKIGNGDVSIVATDLTGNGKLDLLMANGRNVTEALGNGDGTFQTPRVITQPLGSIAVGEFDGTMIPGLAGTDGSSKSYGTAVLLGKTGAGFQSPLLFNTGQPAQGLAVADLNKDGKPDIAVNESTTLSILLNTASPAATLSPDTLVFGDQTLGSVSRGQTLHLTNPGYEPLSISSVAVTAEFEIQNHCGGSLAEGQSCGIEAAFKPTAAGSQSGSITITDNASDSPQALSLSGAGTFIGLAPSTLNFGTVKVGQTSAPQTVTVTNVATRAISIDKISTTEMFQETSTCSPSLAAKASCTVTVTFSPLTTGTQSGSLALYDDGGGSPQTVSVTGSGD